MTESRIAVVTGASRGIGAAIAARLQADRCLVATLDRTAKPRDGILAVHCDVTDADSVDAAFSQVEQQLGVPSIIVANAGITQDTLLMRMQDDQWNQVLDLNLTGAYRVVRRAVRGLVKNRWGRIVLTSSVVALSGSAGQTNYAASKAGLIGFGRSLAAELGSRGITANIVTPGFIQTDMTAELPEAAVTDYLKRIPADRFGTAEDVAAAVGFLCSQEAGYISGAVIPVDGGMGMGH
jgi:3-oxoacyl-[acyl-carrier protein] reductase